MSFLLLRHIYTLYLTVLMVSHTITKMTDVMQMNIIDNVIRIITMMMMTLIENEG